MPDCLLCREPILPGERLDPNIHPKDSIHYECGLRSVLGGLNHMKGTCTCFGGTDEPDPPGLTSREAARAATEYWRGLSTRERNAVIMRPHKSARGKL